MRLIRIAVQATFALMLSSSIPTALAQGSEAELNLLREQLQALAQRIDALESANRELQSANRRLAESTDKAGAPAAATRDPAGWADRIRWSGDFRYRYEKIDEELKSTRNRSRIRARTALTARVFDDFSVGIGLASGGDDPVSSNQTLGGGGTTKDVGLDLAYFDWSGLENTHIIGGKFKNTLDPVGGNQLLFDSDWRPEGTAITWNNGRLYAGAMGTWLEGDSNRKTHFAWIAELGFNASLGEAARLRAGVSYHEFDTAGRASVFGDGDFFGNSFDPVTQTYRYDYHGLEVFAEVGMVMFGLPAVAYLDYINNQAADDFDTGYEVGLQLGDSGKPGGWDVSWAYRDVEADAVLGLLTDSDFGGGGTDARGHTLTGSYALRKNLKTKVTYFINEIDGDLGTAKDFDRLMLDLSVKF